MDRTGHRGVTWIVAVATIGGLLFGYDSGAVNGTQDGLRSGFGLSEAGLGFTVGSLLIGCIVGGYAWSALRAVSAKEEMRATMQEEFTRQFAEFAARQNQPAATTDPAGGTLASGNRDAGAAESVAQLPPCKIDAHPDEVGPVICTERDAQPIALCAARASTACIASMPALRSANATMSRIAGSSSTIRMCFCMPTTWRRHGACVTPSLQRGIVTREWQVGRIAGVSSVPLPRTTVP